MVRHLFALTISHPQLQIVVETQLLVLDLQRELPVKTLGFEGPSKMVPAIFSGELAD